MIVFDFDLLDMIRNYLLCGAGIWVVVMLIRYLEPELIKTTSLWKTLFVINLIAIFPISFLVAVEVDQAIPSQWMMPSTLSSQTTLFSPFTQTTDHINLSSLLITIYVLGFSLFSFRFIQKLRQLRHLINRSQIHPIDTIATKKQMEIIERHNIKLKICKLPISPFAFGFFNPEIILPAYIYELPNKQSSLLIEHELCHLEYGDPKVLLIGQLFCCLFWFNPMNWFYLKHLNTAMEFRVDSNLTKRKKIDPKLYAKTLLDVVKNSVCALPHSILVSSVKSNQNSEIKKRIITMMLNTTTSHRKKIKSLVCWTLMMATWPFYLLTAKAQPHNDKPWIYPLDIADKVITSKFKAVDEIRKNKPHLGVDLKAPIGTNIIAPSAGRIMIADETTMHRNYGKVVVVLHENGVRSFFAHLRDFNVKVGEQVKQGDILGTVGVTGKSTGPHLHMEVVLEKTHLDPLNFISMAL